MIIRFLKQKKIIWCKQGLLLLFFFMLRLIRYVLPIKEVTCHSFCQGIGRNAVADGTATE
jgi:hypothetical protein